MTLEGRQDIGEESGHWGSPRGPRIIGVQWTSMHFLHVQVYTGHAPTSQLIVLGLQDVPGRASLSDILDWVGLWLGRLVGLGWSEHDTCRHIGS